MRQHDLVVPAGNTEMVSRLPSLVRVRETRAWVNAQEAAILGYGSQYIVARAEAMAWACDRHAPSSFSQCK